MRSRLALLLLCTVALTAQAEPPSPTRAEVEAAVQKLRLDPNLPGTKKDRVLSFKDWPDPDEKEKPKPPSGDYAWLNGLAEWLNSAGRVLVWALGAVLVVFVLFGLRQWMRVRAESRPLGMAPPPSHVRDLDIRPESLPAQIGPAAQALWQRGEHRPALSLLYRGALSRLVHGHGVAIRAASTEGDCLALARKRLSDDRAAYFERLVRAWQLAVYGGRMPDEAEVLALCEAFERQMAAPLRPAAAVPEPAR